MADINEKPDEQMASRRKQPREYLVKFIPDYGTAKSLRLPASLLRYGLASIAALSLLFVGAVSFGVYSFFVASDGDSENEDLRRVNSIQQEQLLQLSRRANVLQDQVNLLTDLEAQIRRQTGIPSTGQGAAQPIGQPAEGEEKHDGQGGPFTVLDIQHVSEALDMLEKQVAERSASLLALQESLREQQSKIVPMEMLGADSLGVTGLIGGGISITTPSIWPCTGDVSSPYGLRWGGSDFHPGIDIADDMGTPICATADGVVDYAGWNSGGYGNMVDIDHGNGIMTRYAHAMQVVVTSGQQVRRGQIIAYMGSTGFSTGPHCHYEVRIDGQAVNPAAYLY